MIIVLANIILHSFTFTAFIALLDNYETATGVAETVTDAEYKENWRFIDLVYSTKCMELCYKYLKFKGVVTVSPAEFKKEFYNMWFKMYRRTRGMKYIDI